MENQVCKKCRRRRIEHAEDDNPFKPNGCPPRGRPRPRVPHTGKNREERYVAASLKYWAHSAGEWAEP